MSRVHVTGASRGIGRATVRELAARGHHVVATARSLAALEDVPAAARHALEVTDREAVDAALAAAGERDALVGTAGDARSTAGGAVGGRTPPRSMRYRTRCGTLWRPRTPRGGYRSADRRPRSPHPAAQPPTTCRSGLPRCAGDRVSSRRLSDLTVR